MDTTQSLLAEGGQGCRCGLRKPGLHGVVLSTRLVRRSEYPPHIVSTVCADNPKIARLLTIRPPCPVCSIDGFWFLDQLGSLARANVIVQHRHALAGSWGPCFIGQGPEFVPRPDFYTAVLWKQLVGSGAIATSVTAKREGGSSSNSAPLLRVYAHCHSTEPAAKITLVLVNLANHTWSARLPLTDATARDSQVPGVVDMYWLTPATQSAGLLAPTMALNGVPLNVSGGPTGPWAMPTMRPIQKAIGSDGLLDVPALGYGFVVVDTKVAACQ